MAAARLKRWAQRVVGHTDNGVSVISSKAWTSGFVTNPKRGVINYLMSLFPFVQWVSRYNWTWAIGDVIAGLTVGIVLVPQSMSYAIIATLPPEYGLYSSFVGVFVYVFFATSKDISIGPVAVMSLTVAQIIRAVNDKHPGVWDGPTIATTLSFLCGFIVLGLGLLRLGWLVEFIPAPAVSGFMTGSAINIATGQLPGLLGVNGFDTRASVYLVLINTLKALPRTKVDAAFGIVGLFSLYAIRYGLERLARRYPRRARLIFFVSAFRNGIVIIILTLAAWLYCRHRFNPATKKYPLKILLTVPRGFKHVGTPKLIPELMSALAFKLPVATVILLLEHIAIAKSFGRVNGYTINPNQELIGIGVTNTVGTLFNAYPATGSFSRSALSSKSGVRTPAAGWVVGTVVVVALYGLTSLFFWIPAAGLSAVIIHAVADLVASPSQIYSFWKVSPLEFVIFVVGVTVMLFSTIENGIYTAVGMSLVLLLIRVAKPRGHFLGRVTVHSQATAERGPVSRDVYVPLKSNNQQVNSRILVSPPAPGVVIYRFEESIVYANSYIFNDVVTEYVKAHTRRGKDMSLVRPADRPWNDPGLASGVIDPASDPNKPLIRAVVLDFSAISHLDTTGVQNLIDMRADVEKWGDGPVEFHFAYILSPWIRRALVAGGFGIAKRVIHPPHEVAPVVPAHETAFPEPMSVESTQYVYNEGDVEVAAVKRISGKRSYSDSSIETEPIVSSDTPFFHLDLEAAVRAVESSTGGSSNSAASEGKVTPYSASTSGSSIGGESIAD